MNKLRSSRWLFVALAVASCLERSPQPQGGSANDTPNTSVPQLGPAAVTAPSSLAREQVAPRTLRVLHRTLGSALPTDQLPWIVALHGLGDTPEGFAHLFNGLPVRAHVYLLQAPLPYGDGFDWLGERVSGDPEKLAFAIRERLSEIRETVTELAHDPRNRGAAIVTGFSQGGILSFAVAVAGLPHVRAVLPLAGWLPPALAKGAPVLSTHAFHGEADRVVPFYATREMLTQWRGVGDSTELTLTTYADVGHSIPARMRLDWGKRLQELLR